MSDPGPGTTVDPREAIATMLPCEQCGRTMPAHRMQLVASRRMCEDCAAAWPAAGDGAASGGGADSVMPVAAMMKRIDHVVHFGSTALRIGLYALLALLAGEYPVVSVMFGGVLLADFVTWGARAWMDIRDGHRAGVAFDLAVYFLLAMLWRESGGFLPADTEERAIALVAFTGAVTIKGTCLWWRFCHR